MTGESVKVCLSKQQFDKLPIVKYCDAGTTQLRDSFTLENFKPDDMVVQLPCKHVFLMIADGDKPPAVVQYHTMHSTKCIICKMEIEKGTVHR
jgi:hypothetical protein